MNILITGGAGFIGFHLARELVSNGHNVHIIDNLSRGVHDPELERLLEEDRVRFSQVDLLSAADVKKIGNDYHVIYHLAAIIGVSHVLKRPYNVLNDNIAMLSSIIELCKRQKDLQRLVYTSTSEVYAGTLKHFTMDLPTPEATHLALTDLDHPRTSYMLSKIYGEAMCIHSDLPYTILRPHNVYGPRMGMTHVVPELLKKAHLANDGDSLAVFSLDHTRTFCYVNDAATMLRLAVEDSACTNKTLNLGTQQPEITIRELAQLILSVTDKRMSLDEKAPSPGSPARRCPDMTAMTKLLGKLPHTTLEEGVSQTFAWYRQHIFENEGICAV